jgi:hypothetical protein
MRDELVVERKQVGVDETGKPIMVDCILDATLYFRVVEKILAYCWGQSLQKVDLTAKRAGRLASRFSRPVCYRNSL